MSTNQWGGTATAGGSTSTFTQSSYPVNVTIERQASYSKFFAIPVVGYVARAVMLIPHIIGAYVMAIVAMLLSLVLWIPVLTGGQYPAVGYQVVGGTLRWWVRIAAYLYGLTDQYPPFGLGSENDGYPVNVSFQPADSSSKLFAIPVVGYLIRYILLIPHLIALYVIGAVVSIMQLGLWVPVLFGGGYPEVGYSFVGGYLRWSMRVGAYFFGLTDVYPPFQLGN
jgi:hypothetical protein